MILGAKSDGEFFPFSFLNCFSALRNENSLDFFWYQDKKVRKDRL
jgi:hypothetical protein